MKFPNQYIQGDITKNFGISRKFYLTYLLISKYRSYEGYSWITIKKVLEFYGVPSYKRRTKAFDEVLDVLRYMINSGMILIEQKLDDVSFDAGIEIKICPERFYPAKDFSKITYEQFDAILKASGEINIETVLMVFLYVLSYIGSGKPILTGTCTKQGQHLPMAFYRSINHMAEDLSISKPTIRQCFQVFTDGKLISPPLLIKAELDPEQKQKFLLSSRIPNIYVLNTDDAESEIFGAINYISKVYSKNSMKG